MSKNVQNYIEQFCELKIWKESGEIPRERLLEELSNIDGLYTSSASGGQIDEELLEYAKQLKVVSNVSVGYNNFNLEAMKKHHTRNLCLTWEES